MCIICIYPTAGRTRFINSNINSSAPWKLLDTANGVQKERLMRADQLNRISPQVRIKHHQLLKRAFGPHQTTTFAAKQRADLMSHQGSPAPWSCPKLRDMPPAAHVRVDQPGDDIVSTSTPKHICSSNESQPHQCRTYKEEGVH